MGYIIRRKMITNVPFYLGGELEELTRWETKLK